MDLRGKGGNYLVGAQEATGQNHPDSSGRSGRGPGSMPGIPSNPPRPHPQPHPQFASVESPPLAVKASDSNPASSRTLS